MNKIIICADDFGRSHERNLAIDYAFNNGLITSAGLLINSEFTKEAIELACMNGTGGGYLKKVHCHLNLKIPV